MKMLKKLLNFFLSLRTAIWLMLALVLMLLFGSVIMPGRPEFSSMNSMPLFDWLTENNVGITWWLYGSIALISLLTASTLICSIESLIRKQEYKRWLLIIAPQVIHIGFLFILFAHLLSSTGSFRENVAAREGSLLMLPNNLTLKVKDVSIDVNPSGYISDWAANVEYLSGSEKIREDFIKPNSPSFYRGLGIYLKDVQAYPVKAVLLEISREPGAFWALIGAVFFMVGTITLLLLKITRESY